jgi:hypothetical protein
LWNYRFHTGILYDRIWGYMDYTDFTQGFCMTVYGDIWTIPISHRDFVWPCMGIYENCRFHTGILYNRIGGFCEITDFTQGFYMTVYGDVWTIPISHRDFVWPCMGIYGNCRFHTGILYNRIGGFCEITDFTQGFYMTVYGDIWTIPISHRGFTWPFRGIYGLYRFHTGILYDRIWGYMDYTDFTQGFYMTV